MSKRNINLENTNEDHINKKTKLNDNSTENIYIGYMATITGNDTFPTRMIYDDVIDVNKMKSFTGGDVVRARDLLKDNEWYKNRLNVVGGSDTGVLLKPREDKFDEYNKKLHQNINKLLSLSDFPVHMTHYDNLSGRHVDMCKIFKCNTCYSVHLLDQSIIKFYRQLFFLGELENFRISDRDSYLGKFTKECPKWSVPCESSLLTTDIDKCHNSKCRKI
jgi:hypothetical protein